MASRMLSADARGRAGYNQEAWRVFGVSAAHEISRLVLMYTGNHRDKSRAASEHLSNVEKSSELGERCSSRRN